MTDIVTKDRFDAVVEQRDSLSREREALRVKVSELQNDVHLRTAERDQHMKRADQMAREMVPRSTIDKLESDVSDLIGRVASCDRDIAELHIGVEVQRSQIRALVAALTRAESEIVRLRGLSREGVLREGG